LEDNSNVKKFYQNDYDERLREGGESLEHYRSRRIIARQLRDEPMEIADICGATGAYSFWLAKMGHRVHLLDLMENHIEAARIAGEESGIRLESYICADARVLPYADNSMDMVLLMGAMYHLHSREARLDCLREAHRVLKPGGALVCTIISRYTQLIATLKYRSFDDYPRDYIENSLRSGVHPKANFYFHTTDEIADELAAANFENIRLIAVEGIANALTNNQIPDDDTFAKELLWAVERTESDPNLLCISRNIIAVSNKA